MTHRDSLSTKRTARTTRTTGTSRTARTTRDAKRLTTDRRGASEVLGVVLAFALVTSLVSVVQLTAVPVWNENVEYAHSQAARAAMVELDEAVAQAASTGVGGSVTVDPGVDYPTRLLFVNPAAAGGSIETSDPGSVTISNADAVGSASKHWDGGDRTYETRSVVFETDYRELDPAPTTTYEGAVLFTTRGSSETVARQSLLSGNRITLVLLDGDVSGYTTDPVTVDVDPVSAGGDPVVLTNSGGDPITITLPTRLSEASWNGALDGTAGSVAGYTAPAGDAPGSVTIELDDAYSSYELRTAKVSLSDAGSVSDPVDPAYLVAVDGNGEHVPADGTQQVVVEARDEYDNPVAGAKVSVADAPSHGGVAAVSGGHTATTDADGRATFVYAADDVASLTDDSFEFELADVAPATGVTTATVTLEVRPASTGSAQESAGDSNDDSSDESNDDGWSNDSDSRSGGWHHDRGHSLGGDSLAVAFAAFPLVGRTRNTVRTDSRRTGSRPKPTDRNLRDSDRATSGLLALLFAFAIAVALVALLQVSAVPVWTQSEEIGHSQRVAGDMAELDAAIEHVAADGSGTHRSVEAGVEYRDRPLFIAPPDSAGTLETTAPATATVSNAVAADGNDPAGKYWDGTRDHTYEAQALVYHAEYHELADEVDSYHEGSVSFERHGDGTERVVDQILVDGDTVTLVFVSGDVAESRADSASVDVDPISVGGNPVVLTNAGDDPIAITLPTHLSKAGWEAALDGTGATVGDYDASTSPATVTIELEKGRIYRLQTASVGVDAHDAPVEPAYAIPTAGDEFAVPLGGSQLATVELRDRYDNPVSGVRLHVDGVGGLAGSLTTVDGAPVDGNAVVRTDENGRATLRYVAPDSVSGETTDSFEVETAAGPNDLRTVEFRMHLGGSADPRDDDDDGGDDCVATDDTCDTGGDDTGGDDTCGVDDSCDTGDDDTPDFDIDDGEVVPSDDYTASVDIVAVAIRMGGDGARIPVEVDVGVGGRDVTPPWPDDVNTGDQYHYDVETQEAGTAITVTAEANGMRVKSTDVHDRPQLVYVLRDGSAVPDVPGYKDQASVGSYLVEAGYVDTDTNTIDLEANQAIYLFELGSTDERSDAFDLQDVVVLVTLDSA